jgi:hypothetical protein
MPHEGSVIVLNGEAYRCVANTGCTLSKSYVTVV